MKRLKVILALTGAILAGPAFAADIATKAPPATVGYPYAGNGWYFGVGASAAAGSSTLANSGVLTTGAGVDIVGGYQWKGGLDFVALEVDATYTNLGASAVCNPTAPSPAGAASCGTSSNWEIEPLIKFGFPISTLTAALPNLQTVFPALPNLPASFAATNAHPYIYGGIPIRDVSANYGLATGSVWNVQGELGGGVMYQVGQGLVADTRAGCSFGGGGVNLTGPAGVQGKAETNTTCTARLEFLY
jgi:hypothetical protein